MIVIDKLASSLNRHDEKLNVESYRQIADENDRAAVRELVNNLRIIV
ncbi:MAG: hypothetical protein ABI792_08075 [bacterium]